MQSFLNKIGKTAGVAANKAGSKANELLELGKLKGKIGAEKQNIKAAKAAIGDYCYDLFQQDCIDNEKIREYCEKIRVYEDNIADLQQQIRDVRTGADSDIDMSDDYPDDDGSAAVFEADYSEAADEDQ